MAKDRFTARIECPKCGKDGWAFVKGAQDTTVTNVSEGFTRVKKPSYWGRDVNFTCDDCGELSAAEPKR